MEQHTLSLDDDFVVPTRFWHRVDDGRVQCDLCPRACRMKAGQRGLCFVRANVNDQVVLATYGRSSGFAVDPIEKKPLNHFYPGSKVLSFGTAGCNLACKFCQNWDISKSREMDALMSRATPEAIARAAVEHGCKSVAYTYNDPVIFYEYATDTAAACRDLGVKSVAVSAGYINSPARESFFNAMDATNIDLKAFTEDFYWKLTGAHMAPILETLKYIHHETSAWLEITTLLIPGHNDSDHELHELSQWISEHLSVDVPVHFSAFHPDFKMQDTPATPKSTLQRARKIAMEHGLRYVYSGNVHDLEGDTTFCGQCGEALVVRDWYVIKRNRLDVRNGVAHCPSCDAEVVGRF